MAGEITGYRAIDDTANYYIPYLRTVDQVKLRKELKRDADRLRDHGGEGLKDRHNLLHKLRELSSEGFSRREDIPSNMSESSSYKLTAENQ